MSNEKFLKNKNALLFNRVIIFSPVDAITGGPEALHQLSYEINKLGGNAGLMYYSKEDFINFDKNKVSSPVTKGKANQAYARYNPVVYESVDLVENDLLIFPEVMSKFAEIEFICKKGIWWLSVDNAISANSNLNYPRLNNTLFQDKEIYHFYQSNYARHFLTDIGAHKLIPLYDYTSINLNSEGILESNKNIDISIFPNKGAHLAGKFLNNAKNFKFNLIQNMSREEVANALSLSKIYIDFGHQPGKDRVPREASLFGNIVFLHHKGAGSYYEDSPLDNVYLFCENDIETGNLKARVALAINNFELNFNRQKYYRNKVINEQKEFELQVKNFFDC